MFSYFYLLIVYFLCLKLIESGEKEKLMELLRERLIECGWRDEMKALCRFNHLVIFLFLFIYLFWLHCYLCLYSFY